ncbi:hypothetical protein DFH94DRAFT_771826 [Russula ochroleuca]|uniref:Secreted protein n=1 Tax=Russula ochroleuca TaxID=152965 RepID=A0A9P5MR21_9AGAM|nr:hypothetical protein DFH94DRAFT_771826 [Russula ochroleuca]
MTIDLGVLLALQLISMSGATGFSSNFCYTAWSLRRLKHRRPLESFPPSPRNIRWTYVLLTLSAPVQPRVCATIGSGSLDTFCPPLPPLLVIWRVPPTN